MGVGDYLAQVVVKQSMSAPFDHDIVTLRAAYAAFNARDADAVLVHMTADVQWPRAFKGGFVHGPEEIRDYWTEQWAEVSAVVEPVSFHPPSSVPPEGLRQILVVVHQIVRDLNGALLADVQVGHRFTFKNNLIQLMEIETDFLPGTAL
jgi:ketosteroid isomerase-like protein